MVSSKKKKKKGKKKKVSSVGIQHVRDYRAQGPLTNVSEDRSPHNTCTVTSWK